MSGAFEFEQLSHKVDVGSDNGPFELDEVEGLVGGPGEGVHEEGHGDGG